MPGATWRRSATAGSLVAALAAGCTTEHYSASADRDVSRILGEYHEKALADRPSRVKMPKAAEPAPGAAPGGEVKPGEGGQAGEPAAGAPSAAPEVRLQLDLKNSLLTAMKSSRSYRTQRESLYLSGLGMTLTEFNYGPKFSAAVNALWGKSEGAPRTDSLGGSFGVTQLLPTNGSISLSSGVSRSFTAGQPGGTQDWSTDVGVSLSQPLLRGFGYDQYSESMTQAQRSLVYSVRGFELFREQFVINIAQQYFALVSSKKQLVNQESQLDKARFDEAKTQALRDVDRKTEQDVILAKRNRIQVEQRVLNARTDYRRQVESYLVELGLDSKTPVEIVEDEPPFEPVSFDPESVVEVALANRLDVQTQREQLEDQERRFRLQRQDFLPDLNFTASTGVGGAGTSFSGAAPDQWDRSAGLSLSIPLQQISERNAWRQAEIGLDQAHRDWDQFLDGIRTNLRADLRNLKNLEEQIELDKHSIEDEEKAVQRLEVMQSSGTVSARDLIDSRQRLVDSQNQLIRDQASHFIARLSFFKDTGLLFVDDEGRWNIGSPVPEDQK